MSVNDVFGANLRSLSVARGSLAKAGSDLGINRVQFQRYLKAESFPKPNELKRICAYFGVDARILTEPLTPELAAQMAHGGGKPMDHKLQGWISAVQYASPAHDYFSGPHGLEDGLYVVWRWSLSQLDKVIRMRIRVSTVDGIKVVRGYEDKGLFGSEQVPTRLREYRGFCLKLPWGYAMFFFAGLPSNVISNIYVSPNSSVRTKVNYSGYCTLAREELVSGRRLTRVLIERIEGGPGQLVREAHRPTFYDPADVPKWVMDRISVPLG